MSPFRSCMTFARPPTRTSSSPSSTEQRRSASRQSPPESPRRRPRLAGGCPCMRRASAKCCLRSARMSYWPMSWHPASGGTPPTRSCSRHSYDKRWQRCAATGSPLRARNSRWARSVSPPPCWRHQVGRWPHSASPVEPTGLNFGDSHPPYRPRRTLCRDSSNRPALILRRATQPGVDPDATLASPMGKLQARALSVNGSDTQGLPTDMRNLVSGDDDHAQRGGAWQEIRPTPDGR